MAYLGEDEVMISALTTPGKDLHTETAVGSFKLVRLNADETLWDETEMLALAKKDMKAFKKLQETFKYKTPQGEIITQSAMEKRFRSSAKSVNFGIAYGRGAKDIAAQILAETGTNIPASDIQEGIDGWKTTYPKAWAMLQHHQELTQTQGYVESPMGFRRYFPKVRDEALQAAQKREGGNLPIQNTVSELMRVATRKVIDLRGERALDFIIINQVHDALFLIAPISQLDESVDCLETGMTSVGIPMPSGETVFLRVDTDIYSRWGEKYIPEEVRT